MAARLGEARQAAIAARERLRGLEQERDDAKNTHRALLVRQADGTLTEADRAALAAAEQHSAKLDDRVRAARQLVTQAEADEAAAVAEAEELKKTAVSDGSRIGSRAPASAEDNREKDPKRGFSSHSEFYSAVMEAGRGRRLDERLRGLAFTSQPGGREFLAAAGSDEHGTYSDQYGGFTVPRGFLPGILTVAPEDDPTASLVTNIPMRTPTIDMTARVDKNHSSSVSGGLTVTRKAETASASSSRMAVERITMRANSQWGFAYATEELLNDSPESYFAILDRGFRDEYGAAGLNERLNGTGVGEPLGVIHANNGCLVTVSKEAGQAATTIVKANIDKMIARCWRFGRAIWLANHDTIPQLMSLSQAVGTGGAPVAYLNLLPVDGGMRGTLAGRPIFFTEFAKTLGTKGDLILGVWSEYLYGRYQPLRSEESIHVRFDAGERCFRFHQRDDGQPWWRSALTPKNGSNTLSPFVVLETRS